MTSMIGLWVPGRPTGKGRPRFAQGRTFTPKETTLAEEGIRSVWRASGEPRLPDGPVQVQVSLCLERPASHFKRDGSLSAEGARHPHPCRKPDLDNAVKLVMDSLNGLAYRDDVQVVSLCATRSWSSRSGTRIVLWEV